MEQAIFAAGCFWGVEESFRILEGVTNTEVGYTGGKTDDPTYELVCRGNTGHAEAVRVEYDPAKISFGQLLINFWTCHTPTQLNRQGPDIGSQYRSAIFYVNDEQKEQAEASKTEWDESGKFRKPIVTEITAASEFYRAEEYHQQYVAKRGGSSCHM